MATERPSMTAVEIQGRRVFPVNGALTPSEPISVVSDNGNGLTPPNKELQPENPPIFVNGQEVYGIIGTTRKIFNAILNGKLEAKLVHSDDLLVLCPKKLDSPAMFEWLKSSIDGLRKLLNESGLTIGEIANQPYSYLYDLEAITKPNGETAGDQGNKKLFGTKYIVEKLGWNITTVQSKIHKEREKDPNFGILIQLGLRGRKWYLLTEAEIKDLKDHSPDSPTIEPGLSLKDIQDAKMQEKIEEKNEQRKRGAARINRADQDKPTSVDFAKAILTHLKNNPDPKPLESLPKDFKVFIETYMPNNTSLEQLTGNGALESLKIFAILSLKATLTGILNSKNGSQLAETKEANSIVTAYGGVEKLAEDIAEHFSVHMKKPQVTIRPTSSPERKFPEGLGHF